MSEVIDVSDDEANLPSAAECDARCKEFAAITATDSACAMFFLQDRDWNVQVIQFNSIWKTFIHFIIRWFSYTKQGLVRPDMTQMQF